MSDARTLQDRVRAFHKQFGFHVGTDPMVPPPDQIRYERAGLIAEEAGELCAELLAGLPLREHERDAVLTRFADKFRFGIACNAQAGYNSLRVMRETADLHVGILGAAINGAFELDRVTAVVCESNLTRSGPDERGMAFKGERFVPPDMRRAIDPKDESIAELRGLGNRAWRGLRLGGYKTVREVALADPVALLSLSGVGVAALREIRAALGHAGAYHLWWFEVVDDSPGLDKGRLISAINQARPDQADEGGATCER